MTENPNYGPQWGAVPPNQPGQTGGHPYPPYGQSGQYPGPPTQYGAPVGPPAGPNFFTQLPLAFKLALGSAVLGVITFFMGFLSWVTIDDGFERKANRWAEDAGGEYSIPAFLTMLFTPGYFLLFLGAAGVAAFAFAVPKWRKYLPHVAALVVLSWLGLLACALALPPFISLGAGAIVSLILGAVQLGLIGTAVILDGRTEEK